MEIRTIFISYVVWLLFVRFLAGRGLGPFGSFARDLSGFMLGKGLGPAAELMEEKPQGAAKVWFAHGIFWFIIAATLTFLELWTTYEPYALHSLGAIGYAPTAAQAAAAVHVTTAFGALSMTLIAAGFAVQARLSGGRLANEATTALLAFLWSAMVAVGLILAHTDLIGGVVWFELPPIYYMLMSILAIPLFVNHLLTQAQSPAPALIPQWFIIMGMAAFIWLGPMSMILLSGENHTLAWLLTKILFGGWFFSQAMGVAHYVVPAALGRPLWSRTLATMTLFGTFLTFSPLGSAAAVPEMSDMMRSVVAILLSLSLLPLIAAVVNLTRTASGRVMESYSVKFVMVGTILLVPIGLGSLFASVSAFGGANELAHISSTLDTMVIWGVIGMVALGGVHQLFPEASGRALFSSCKTKMTFWFSTIAVVGFGASQFIADYVNHNLSGEVATALEEAGIEAAGAGEVEIFAAMLFYGVAIAGIFAAQNMIQGAFRGARLADDSPTASASTDRITITGTTSLRRLLAAGAGPDTVIEVMSSSAPDSISLADIPATSASADEVEVADETPDEATEESPAVNLKSLLKADLVKMAKAAGLPTSGTKSDLIDRLSA